MCRLESLAVRVLIPIHNAGSLDRARIGAYSSLSTFLWVQI